MAETVVVNITATAVPPSSAGFGVTLIPSPTAAWSGPAIRSYASAADMIADYPGATCPERLDAAAFFAQPRRAAMLKFMRMATKPTTVYTLSMVAPARASYAYQARVGGLGFAEQLVSWTSDATPTEAEWAAGFGAALTAVVGRNFSAAGAAALTLTGNAPGAWFYVEVLDPDAMTSTETTADPGVAADLDAALSEDADFFYVTPPSGCGSRAAVVATATWVEANARQQLAGVSDSAVVTGAVGGDDVADRVKTNAYKDTGLLWHRAPQARAAAAWVGHVSPFPPGGINYAHRVLSGVPGYRLTGTHEARALSKSCSVYTRSSSGRFVTFEGRAGDGGFLDDRRSAYWLGFKIKAAVDGVLQSNPVVLYDLSGLGMIEAAIVGVMGEAQRAGVASNDPYTITMPTLDEISDEDRLNRVLPNVSVDFRRGGGLNRIVINIAMR